MDFRILSVLWIALFVSYSRVSSESSSEISIERIPTSVEIDDADLDDKSEEEEDDDGGNSPKAVLQKYGKDKVLKLISKLRALTKLKNKIAKEMSWKQFLAIVKKSKLKSTNKKKSILKTVQSKQTNSANTEKAISSNSSNLNKKGIDPTSHISKKERINSQSTPSEISSPVVAKPIETGSHTSSSTGTSQPQKLPSMIPSRQSQTSNASPIPPASIISSFTLTKNKPAFSSMSNTHTTEVKPAGEVFKEQSVSTTKLQNAPSIPVFKSPQNINQNVIPAQSDVKSRFLIKAPTNAPTDHSAHTSSRMGQKDITSQTHHASSMVPTLKSDPKPVFIPKIIAPTAVFSINKHESKATQLNAGTRSNHLKTIDVDPVGTFPIHKPMPSPLPTPTTPATVQLPDKLSAGIISNSIQPRLTNLSPTSAAGIVSVPDVSQLHMGQQKSLGTKISAPSNTVRTIQGPKFTDVTNIHDIGVVNEQKSSVRNFASAVPSKENSQVKITTTVESATVSVPFIVVNPTPLTTKFTFSVVKPSIRQSTSFKSTKVQTSSSVDTPASAQLPSMTSDKNPSAVVDTSHVVDNGLVASSLSGHSMPNNLIKSQKVKPTIHKPTKLVPTTINIDSKLAPNINVKASRLPSGHKRTKMLLNRLVMLRRRILALRRQKQMEELSAERMRTEKIRAAASAERLRKAHRLKASAEKMRKAKKRASFSSSSGSAEIDDSGENSGSAESHVTAKYNEAKRLQRMKKAITKILQLSKQGRLKLSTKALKLIAKWIRIIKRQGKKVHSMPMQQRNRVVKVSSDKSNIATSNLSSVKDKTAAMSVTDTDNINTIKSKESMQTNTNTASAVSPQTHNIVHTANSLNNPISVVDPTSIPVHANDASVSRLEMHPVKKQSFEVFSLKKAKAISSTKASSLVDSNKPGGVIIRKGQGQAVDIPKTSASFPINNEGLIHPSQPQGGSQSGILQEKGIDLSISQHSVGGKIPSASGTSNSITNSKTLEQSPETNNNIVGFIQDKNTAGTESSLSSVSNVFSKQDIKSKIPGKQGQESANSILKFDSSSSVKGIPIPLDTPSTLKSSLTAQVSNAAPDSRTEIAKFRARESRRLRTTLQRLAMARKLRQQLLEKRNQNGLSDSSAEHIAKNSIINNSPSSKSFIFKSHQTFTNQNSIRRKRRKRSVKKEETEIADKNLRKRRHLGGFGSPGGVFVDGSLNQLGFQNFMGPKNQPNILGGIPIQMNGGLVSPREVSNMIMSNPSNQGNFFVPPYKRKSSSYDKKKPTNTYEKRNQNNIVNNLSSLGNFRPGSGGGGIPLFVANNEVPNVEQGGFIVQQMQPPQMSQPSLQQQHIHQRNLQQQMIQQELQQQQLQREIQQQQLQQELQQQQMQREIHQQQIQQELQQQQIQREIQQQQLQQELQRQQLQQQQIHISQTMNLAQQLPPGTQLPNINLNQLSQQSPQPKKSYATNSLNNFNAPPNVKRIHIHRQIGNYEKKDPSSYDKPAGGLSQARVGLSSGNAVESYAVRDSYPKVNTHLHNKVATQHSVVHSTLGAPQQQMMVQQQLGAVPQHMHGQEVTVHVEPAVSRPVIIDQQRNHQPKFIQISKQIQSLRPVDVHQSLNQPVHHMQEHSLQQPHRHETVLHEHHEPSVHNQLNMHHHHHEHTVHHQHQEPTVHHQHQEPSVHHHHEPTVHHQHQEPSMHHHHEPKVHHHHQEPSVHHHHEPTVHHHHHHHHHQEPVIHHEPSLHQPHPDHIVHKGLHLPPPPPHMMPPPPPPPQPIVVVEEPPPPPPQPIVVVEEPPVMMNNIHSHPSESVAGQLLSGAPVMTQSLGDFGAGSLGGGIGIGMRGGAFNQGQLQPAIQIPANIVKEPVQLPPPATLTNNMRPSTGILDNQQQVFVDRPVQNQGLSSGGQNPGFGSVLSATPFIGTGEQYGGGVSVDLFDAHNHASEGWDPPMKVKQTSEAKKDIKGVQDLQKPKKAEPIIDGVIGGSTLSNSLDKPSASLSRMHAAIQNEIFNFVPKSIAKDAKFTAAAYEKKVDAYEKKALANEQQAEAYDKKMDVYANTLESYDKAAQAEQGTYDKVPESNQYDKQSHSLSYDKHMTKPETVEYNPPQPDVVQSQVIVDYNPQEPSPIYTQPPEPTMVSQGPSEPARVQYSPPGQYEGFVVGDPYKLSEYVQTPKPPQRLKPEKVNPTEGIPVSYNSMEKNKLSGPFIQDKFSQQMPPSGDMAGSLFNSWANEQRNREPPSTPPPPPPIVAPGDRYGPVEPSNPTQQQYTGSSLSQRLTQPTRGPNNFQGAIESPMLNNEHKRFNEKQQALNSLNSPARDVPYFKEKYQSSNSLAAPSSNAQSFQERQKSYNVMNSPPSDISYFQEKYQSSNSLNAPNPNAQGFIEQIQGSNSLNSPQRDVPYFQEKYQSSNSLNTPDQNAQGFLEKFQASNTLNSPPRDVPFSQENFQSSNSLNAPDKNTQGFIEKIQSSNSLNSPQKYRSSNSLTAPQHAHPSHEKHQGSFSLNSPPRDVPYFEEKFQSSNSLTAPHPDTKHQRPHSLNSPPRDVPYFQETYQGSNSKKPPNSDIPLFNSGYSGGLSGMLSQRPSDSNFNSLSPSYKGQQLAFTVDNPTNKEKITPKNQKQETKVNPFNNAAGGLIVSDRSSQGLSFGGGSLSSIGKDFSGGTANSNYQLSSNMQQPQTENLSKPPRGGAVVFSDKNFLGESGGNSHHSPSRDSAKLSLSGSYIGNHLRAGYLSQGSRTYQEPPPNVNYNNKGDSQRYSLSAGTVA